MRFAKPLDGEAIARELKEGRRFVTIEDGALAGGFGSAVLEYVNSRGFTNHQSPITNHDLGIPSNDSRFTIHDSRTPDHRPLATDHGLSVIRLGYPDHFVEAGKVSELHAHYGLTADGIAATVLASASGYEGETCAETEDSASAQPTVLPIRNALKS